MTDVGKWDESGVIKNSKSRAIICKQLLTSRLPCGCGYKYFFGFILSNPGGKFVMWNERVRWKRNRWSNGSVSKKLYFVFTPRNRTSDEKCRLIFGVPSSIFKTYQAKPPNLGGFSTWLTLEVTLLYWSRRRIRRSSFTVRKWNFIYFKND